MRTPEQQAADDALTAAIQQCHEAYDWDAGVLTEYVVVTASMRWDDDGTGITAIGTIFRDSNLPYHHALGLTDYASTRFRATIAGNADLDTD